MVKSIFRLKKPRSGAFLLIPAPPLVISGCFIFRFKIKNLNQKGFSVITHANSCVITKLLTSISSDTL
ncbi:hypothetical protein BG259_16975 [Vibrio harveyi]|nr:hypothetical protein BG259_16975 [Vibrio harveyi]PQJ37684.1 hypothetical protein BTN99_22610 [Vibrio campbellii]